MYHGDKSTEFGGTFSPHLHARKSENKECVALTLHSVGVFIVLAEKMRIGQNRRIN